MYHYDNLFFIQDVLSPPSDGDNLSDSTNTSDALSGGGLDDVPSVRRSVSFKERRKSAEPETVTKRRNSDVDLQVCWSNLPVFIFVHCSSHSFQILLINTIKPFGNYLYRRDPLKFKARCMLCLSLPKCINGNLMKCWIITSKYSGTDNILLPYCTVIMDSRRS